MSSTPPKIVGFKRIGTGDWFVLDDGTSISTGEGERVLRFLRTTDFNKRSIHLAEAIGYIRAYLKHRTSVALHGIARIVSR